MHLSEVAMAAAITVSIAGVSYAALNTEGIQQTATTVAPARRALLATPTGALPCRVCSSIPV